MNTNIKTITLSELTKKEFSGQRFPTIDIMMAGKILKKQGYDSTVKFLSGKGKDRIDDFKPPAKCNIVAVSRPFTEWPIYKASKNIQEYVYSLTVEEEKNNNHGTCRNSIDNWLKDTKVDNVGFTSVQGLSIILSHAQEIFRGVIKKTENRNEKHRKKLEDQNKWRASKGLSPLSIEDTPITDESGRLFQKPGINPNIYCFQQISPYIFDPEKDQDIVEKLPSEYKQYSRKPNDPILCGVINRLDILKGQPGYIPAWQRAVVNTSNHHRIYKYWSTKEEKIKDAILAVIRIGNDWAILDLRGLLRNVYWRKLPSFTEPMTASKLLSYFSGDPVLDVSRNIASFIYKEGVVKVHSEKYVVHGIKSKELLERLIQEKDTALISIDLGQINPVAAKISRIIKEKDETISAKTISRTFLSDELLREATKYRTASDSLEGKLHREAILKLTPKQQEEIDHIENDSPSRAQSRLCEIYNIDPKAIPWENLTSISTYISDYIIDNNGDKSLAFFETKSKSGKIKICKRRDLAISRLDNVRLKLTSDTRKALNDATWELKRNSVVYLKLSKRKIEFARRCVNFIMRWGQNMVGGSNIVINIEDLNITMFHGSGKRQDGWDNFFIQKKENRWFMQALHKAFSELGPHRGIIVIESRPERTSITCPKCGYYDSKNRNELNRELFKCIKCGSEYNADLEVATDNLEKVALTGKSMPKNETDSERLGGATKTVITRKSKSLKRKGKILEAPESDAADVVERAASRKMADKCAETLGS